jgi:DNA relaxase NicK
MEMTNTAAIGLEGTGCVQACGGWAVRLHMRCEYMGWNDEFNV